ncbi:phytoene desaturase [Motilibacter rhizosphaerae]|uniref:Phytoene desaturase n=1 Tax=Motilibacter rhizosphaerae TaxID=598652 RepID=A0A4Q7NGB6_9ACTN|nr:phytoene desaturase family protein [Motilibacter rhizosphaerae]RZS82941.1 phytoene desaturase [Motilibacter rhizosphaerae]
MPRVVVVGAGMGGLAAAARLRALGHDVVLCERAGRTGGKLAGWSRDGFAFDTGPSLLTLPATYRDLFLKTGAPLEDVVDLQPVDPAFTYAFADGTRLVLPNTSRARTREAVGDALGGAAADDWDALIAHAARVWERTRRPFLEQGLAPRELLALGRDPRAVRDVAPWLTLRGLGRRLLRDPRLRLVLDRYATYAGSDPRRAPAALCTIPFVEQAFGAWHVAGGLQRLGNALEQRVLELGVQLRLGAEVTRVLVEGGRAAGVELAGGERLPADVVVADADAGLVYGSLLPPLPQTRRALRRVRRADRSFGGFVLLLALRGRTPGLTHHTVLFPADYDAEFDAVFAGRTAADPAVYVCSPDDPAMRPEGGEAWFVLVNAPLHSPGSGSAGTDWRAPGVATAYADQVLDLLAARGLDMRQRLLWSEVRTPADLEAAAGAPGGSIYGSAAHGRAAPLLRPANRSPLPGLFLVGGSAHPGGGLPLVALSAAIVAEQVGAA